MVEIISNHPNKTKELGAHIARETMISKKEHTKGPFACVIGLIGDLGAGKTTFIQGFAGELGIAEKVLSPTFLLLKRFDIPKEGGGGRRHNKRFLYHIDAYRLEDHRSVADLGIEEIIQDPSNIVVIEWADRCKKILPEHTIWVALEWLGDEKRKVIINQNSVL